MFNHLSFPSQASSISSPTGESTRSKGAVRELDSPYHHLMSEGDSSSQCDHARDTAISMHYTCTYVKDTEQIFEIMREQCDDSMYSIVTRLQVCYIYTGLKSCYQIQTNKYIFANIFQCTPSVLTKCIWDSLWQRRSSGGCLSWWIGCCHSWTLSLPCAL